MSNKIYNLTVKDFANLFSIEERDMPSACVDIIENKDFRYCHFTRKERDSLILDIMKKIDSGFYIASGSDKKERWEKGWQEILDNFINEKYNKESLMPQYNKKGNTVFLYGDYVNACDDNFENNFADLIRYFIFDKYLKDKSNIYEFGCGSCYNLLTFAEVSPDKYYYGCDWVPQSARIIDKIRENYNFNMHGGIFNMFVPDYNLDIKEDSVALTMGSMEQLGNNFEKFMKFLLSKPFSRYVHENSILGLYDTDNSLMDYFIYKYEKHRNYCDGFFTHLQELGKKGTINIIKMDRIKCGGVFGDGYSITVWEKNR